MTWWVGIVWRWSGPNCIYALECYPGLGTDYTTLNFCSSIENEDDTGISHCNDTSISSTDDGENSGIRLIFSYLCNY